MNESDLYREVGENFRYFSSWRWKLVAGYFVALAAFGYALKWAYETHPYKNGLSRFLFGCGFAFSVIMWLFEMRNRKAMRVLQDAGVTLEELIYCQAEPYGTFTAWRRKDVGKPFPFPVTHSAILDGMWVMATVFFLRMTILAPDKFGFSKLWAEWGLVWWMIGAYATGFIVSSWRSKWFECNRWLKDLEKRTGDVIVARIRFGCLWKRLFVRIVICFPGTKWGERVIAWFH